MKKIEHKIVDDVELKRCTTCKKWKGLGCFNKSRSAWDKLHAQCKYCLNRYYIKNKKYIAKLRKQYRIDNIEKLKQYKEKYYKNNCKQLLEKSKQYRTKNADKIKKRRVDTFEERKQWRNRPALYKLFIEKLCWCEEVRQDGEFLEVKCAYCGRWMKPTSNQAYTRVNTINGGESGENRFYCSENCKISCPIFNKVLWPKGFKKATSREVVPLLRQLVLERDNYTCQKCGATSEEAQLHVHHEKSYALNKIMANDPDNCITLCKSCHKELHKKHGCKYHELRC